MLLLFSVVRQTVIEDESIALCPSWSDISVINELYIRKCFIKITLNVIYPLFCKLLWDCKKSYS